MILAGAVVLVANGAMADSFGTGDNVFNIDFVNISGATNPTSGYGIVNHDYRMGTYEITNNQWDKFKASLPVNPATGQPIPVTGADGGYSYDSYFTGASVPTDRVSWYEAAQFVNWLNTSTNHQAAYKFTGEQGTSNYTFAPWSPAEADGANLYRNKAAFYFLPTENEWVKAAYWNGTTLQTYATIGGVFPTQGNGTNGEGWNYRIATQHATNPEGSWNVGSGSEELNGTHDMMGNVWEWMESPYSDVNYGAGSRRGLSGGYWYIFSDDLAASAATSPRRTRSTP
jgi:formylglycine-generating enzyme required for sulfatase activity